jgi:hypothetical protein
MYDMYPAWDPACAPDRGLLPDRAFTRRQRPQRSWLHAEEVRAVQESLDRRDNGGRERGEDQNRAGALAVRGEGKWPWHGTSG